MTQRMETPRKIVVRHCSPEGIVEEEWRTREDGAKAMTRQQWWANGHLHRVSRPAARWWQLQQDGTRVRSKELWMVRGALHRGYGPAKRVWIAGREGAPVLVVAEWHTNGILHRTGGPAFQTWTYAAHGTRVARGERWFLHGQLHRCDGPAALATVPPASEYRWQGETVSAAELPWLRRGRCFLAQLLACRTWAAPTVPGGSPACGQAWARDTRIVNSWEGRCNRCQVAGAIAACI